MILASLGALGIAGALVLAHPDLRADPGGTGPQPALTTYGQDPAPPIVLPNIAHPADSVSLSRLSGRPVVINFWASWCIPCRREMPVLESAYRRSGARVAFIGVNTNDSRSAALALIRQTGVRYASAFDPRGTAATAYGLFGLPTTFFVDAKGQIVERSLGAVTADSLRAGIARLVGISGAGGSRRG